MIPVYQLVLIIEIQTACLLLKKMNSNCAALLKIVNNKTRDMQWKVQSGQHAFLALLESQPLIFKSIYIFFSPRQNISSPWTSWILVSPWNHFLCLTYKAAGKMDLKDRLGFYTVLYLEIAVSVQNAAVFLHSWIMRLPQCFRLHWLLEATALPCNMTTKISWSS